MDGGGASRRVLVFGATGLVGSAVVRALLETPDVRAVVAPVRRQGPDFGDPRVHTPRVEFGRLGEASADLEADQLFLCLGTTMKKAGSRQAFRRVDFDATVEAARTAHAAGARDAFLVSSVGADPAARGFYLRVKGETEHALATIGFRGLHVFRPSILVGPRTESRPAERMGILLGTLLSPLMLGPARRFRPIRADVVARAMARASERPGEGLVVHESERIARSGR